MAGQHPKSLKYYPQPKLEENLIFMDHQKKELPNSMMQKVVDATPTVALTRVLLSQGAMMSGFQITSMILTSCQTESVQL